MISLTSTSTPTWEPDYQTLPMPLPDAAGQGPDSERMPLDANAANWQPAQPIAGPPDTVHSGSHAAPIVATNGAGQVWVAWRQAQPNATGLALARYADGFGWSGAEVVDTGASVALGYAKLHLNELGDALLVWRDAAEGTGRIWAKRYLSHEGWQPALLLRDPGEAEVFAPEVACDEQGNALVAWQETHKGYNRLWSRHFDAQTGWKNAQLISQDCVSDASALQIALNARGEALAIWRQVAANSTLAWCSFHASNGRWEEPTLLGSENAGHPQQPCQVFEPRMAMNAQGRALAVWVQIHDSQSSLWACWREPGTSTGRWGHAKCLVVGRKSQILNAQLALNDKDQATVVWEQCNAQRVQLGAMSFSPDLGWGEINIVHACASGLALQPALCMDAQGNALLAWQQRDGLRRNVWVSRQAGGTHWRSPRPIASNHGAHAFDPHLAMNAQGEGALAWQQVNSLGVAVWASMFR
jgi:hypothetical protein